MPKPRRATAEAFYDVFSDMPIAEQVIALRILQETHRQAVKLDKRKPAAEKDKQCKAFFTPASDNPEKCTYCDGPKLGHPNSQGSLLDEPAAETGIKLKESAEKPIE